MRIKVRNAPNQREQRAVAAPGAAAVRAESAHTAVPHRFAEAAQAIFAAPTDPEHPQRVLECARHYSEIDPTSWPLRYFSPRELASRSDGLVYVRPEALAALERLRELQERPVVVTSAYRSPAHNASVGGATLSKHTLGHAFDISAANLRTLEEIREFRRNAKLAGFTCRVDYPGSNFIHIDMRKVGALAWSSGGASLGTTADPGAGGEAWNRALGDPDGRVEKSTTATIEKVVTAATATAGTVATGALAPSAEQADGLLSIILKLLPYGPHAVGAVFGGYLLLKYGGWLWFRLSEFWARFRGS